MPEEKMESLMSAEKSGTDEHNDGRKVIMQIENLSKIYFQGKIPVHVLRCACITVKKGELLDNGNFGFLLRYIEKGDVLDITIA